MENEPKNFIPEEILEEANGDPRAAFGLQALRKLDVPNLKTDASKMQVRVDLHIEHRKDLWNKRVNEMDDI